MIDKDPTSWSLGTWALGLVFAFSAGFINWYHKVKKGHTRMFNLVELFGEIFISGFVGMVVFMALMGLGYPMAICAAATGVGGHMGTRLLFAFEKILESKTAKYAEQAKKK